MRAYLPFSVFSKQIIYFLFLWSERFLFFLPTWKVEKVYLVEMMVLHDVKNSKYEVFSGPYFPRFGLNTDIYE